MDEKTYKNISNWFRRRKNRLKIFNFCYLYVPYVVGLFYLISIEIVANRDSVEEIVRMLIVPFVTFVICTVIRKLINKKRPYEAMNIKPLIPKNKVGQSFPSRHMVSVSVLMIAGFYADIRMGIVLLLMTIIIGIMRPVAGVHYIIDVIAGFIMGSLCGIIGFFII